MGELLSNKRLLAVILGGILAACSGDITGDEEDGVDEEDDGDTIVGDGDPTAITIEIESPPRGTLSETIDVTVFGRVTSNAGDISELTVNGKVAALASDGSFQVPIALTEGITLIETLASDSAGN